MKMRFLSTIICLAWLSATSMGAAELAEARRAWAESGRIVSPRAYALVMDSGQTPRGSLTSMQPLVRARVQSEQRVRDRARYTTRPSDEGVEVLARVYAADESIDLGALLAGIGVDVAGVARVAPYCDAWVSYEDLRALEALGNKGILAVTVHPGPRTNTGSVTSQADTTHEAARVRSVLGIDGSGVRVGVLSDSYDRAPTAATSAAEDVASGDLPANVMVLTDDAQGLVIDEGRAMMQLIHDLAPGADLYFATAFDTPTIFAANIRALRDAGCQIIVDDIFYPTEPFFQDGEVALAVAHVFDGGAGAAYFSSAGNFADTSWEAVSPSVVSDAGVLGRPGAWIDFDPGPNADPEFDLLMLPGQSLQITLQWDDPFFASVDTDLDIYLIDAKSGAVVAGSFEDNISGTHEPLEFFGYVNGTGAPRDLILAIEHVAGPIPGRVKFINFDDDVLNEYDTSSSTIFGHPGSDAAMAVGAASYLDALDPEAFSSYGPVEILFDPAGNPTAPTTRAKPDVTAIQRVNTTFFGGEDTEGDGFPNFAGTSAAAPHAAAVAALVLEADPALTAADIYQLLESTATDLLADQGLPGWDRRTGHGLLNAFDALVTPPRRFILFAEDFESGFIDEDWTTLSNNAGRIQAREDVETVGVWSVVLDAFAAGSSAATNALQVCLDARGYTHLQLQFEARAYGESDHVMPIAFTGLQPGDGVAFSVDGQIWYRLVDLTGGAIGASFQDYTADLTQAAVIAGVELGETTYLRFQQTGTGAANSDGGEAGIAYDEIAISGTVSGPKGWQHLHFGLEAVADPDLEPSLWGLHATPNGDGVPNAIKYAVGMDPFIFDASLLPQVTFEGTHLVGTVLSRNADDDLEVLFGVSDDLASGFSFGFPFVDEGEPVDLGNGFSLLEFTDLTPIDADHPARFGRFRFDVPLD